MTKLGKSVTPLIADMAESQRESRSLAAVRATLLLKFIYSDLPEVTPARHIEDAIA